MCVACPGDHLRTQSLDEKCSTLGVRQQLSRPCGMTAKVHLCLLCAMAQRWLLLGCLRYKAVVGIWGLLAAAGSACTHCFLSPPVCGCLLCLHQLCWEGRSPHIASQVSSSTCPRCCTGFWWDSMQEVSSESVLGNSRSQGAQDE